MSNVGINAVQHFELKLQSAGAHESKNVFLHCSITDHCLKAPPHSQPREKTAHEYSMWSFTSLRAVLRQSCAMLQQCRCKNYKAQEIRLRWFSFSFNHLCSSSKFSLIIKKKKKKILYSFTDNILWPEEVNVSAFVKENSHTKVKSPRSLVIELLFLWTSENTWTSQSESLKSFCKISNPEIM